jgi:RNA polymerase sigma factor (sigma-70 family)
VTPLTSRDCPQEKAQRLRQERPTATQGAASLDFARCHHLLPVTPWRSFRGLGHLTSKTLPVVLNHSTGSGESLDEAQNKARSAREGDCARKSVTTANAKEQSDAKEGVERFENFYLREFTSVVGLAYVLSGRSLLAEDIAQEAFMAAQRNWERIGGLESPGGWVRKVVANKASNVRRSHLREARALIKARLKWGVPAGVYELPAEHAEIWSAVRSLPKRQQQVVALYYLQDYSVSEVACVLGIAEGTVKTHLHQGRNTLREQLGDGTEPQ